MTKWKVFRNRDSGRWYAMTPSYALIGFPTWRKAFDFAFWGAEHDVRMRAAR